MIPRDVVEEIRKHVAGDMIVSGCKEFIDSHSHPNVDAICFEDLVPRPAPSFFQDRAFRVMGGHFCVNYAKSKPLVTRLLIKWDTHSEQSLLVTLDDANLISALQRLDDKILNAAFLHSQRWFGRVYEHDELLVRYRPILRIRWKTSVAIRCVRFETRFFVQDLRSGKRTLIKNGYDRFRDPGWRILRIYVNTRIILTIRQLWHNFSAMLSAESIVMVREEPS